MERREAVKGATLAAEDGKLVLGVPVPGSGSLISCSSHSCSPSPTTPTTSGGGTTGSTACLQSPHTVGLYDFGVTEDQRPYYVMELLEGIDLEALVQEFGPQPAERVVAWLGQMCHSLGEAHSCGLVGDPSSGPRQRPTSAGGSVSPQQPVRRHGVAREAS